MLHSKPDGTELAKLNDKHREVLDRLLDHKTSKEIARDLGISASTVEQRLRTAKRILGTAGRSETLVAYRHLTDICEKVTYQNLHLTFDAEPVKSPPRNGDPAVFTLADAAYAPTPPWVDDRVLVPRVLEGNHGTLARLVYIVGAAVGILMIVLVGLSVAMALNWVL